MKIVLKHFRAGVAALCGGATLLLVSAAAPAPAGAAGRGPDQLPAGIQVFVGYADSVRPKPVNFPDPWAGDLGVIYEGCNPSDPSACKYDGGAAMVVNDSTAAVTVNSVIIHFGTCRYDIWPHGVTLPADGELIIDQTVSGSGDGCTPKKGIMDSSDVGPNGAPWAHNCTQSGVIPEVDVTINGTTTPLTDSGQVLNTGGFDKGECPKGTNESEQWTLIGSTPCGGASLGLAPASQTQPVDGTATITGTLTNGCGTPLQSVPLTFLACGSGTGLSLMGTTDTSGQATFNYSESSPGVDTDDATAADQAGSFPSTDDVTVDWTSGSSVASDDPPSGTVPHPAPPITAASWTVTPGGCVSASGSAQVKDTTTGTVAKCTSLTLHATLNSGSSLPGPAIGSITGPSTAFSGCSIGTIAVSVTAGGFPWYLNATSYNTATGVTTGTITGIDLTAAAPGCSATLDGTAAGADNGKVKVTYTNATGKLTLLPSSGNLHDYAVSGCFGLINNGDPEDASGSATISPKQTITSP